jgi:hypothetical protein
VVETSTETIGALLDPSRLWTREEVLARDRPVPNSPGVYAWYFRELPADDLDPSGCHIAHGLPLLYTGIAPRRPSSGGGRPSAQTLRRRLQTHLRGNASASTLRLTLGCLLSERLGLELRRVGDSERTTFGSGEDVLSDWMARNALVCWAAVPEPWEVESTLISRLAPPLNLDQNEGNAFHDELSARRRECRRRARELPVLPSPPRNAG